MMVSDVNRGLFPSYSKVLLKILAIAITMYMFLTVFQSQWGVQLPNSPFDNLVITVAVTAALFVVYQMLDGWRSVLFWVRRRLRLAVARVMPRLLSPEGRVRAKIDWLDARLESALSEKNRLYWECLRVDNELRAQQRAIDHYRLMAEVERVFGHRDSARLWLLRSYDEEPRLRRKEQEWRSLNRHMEAILALCDALNDRIHVENERLSRLIATRIANRRAQLPRLRRNDPGAKHNGMSPTKKLLPGGQPKTPDLIFERLGHDA